MTSPERGARLTARQIERVRPHEPGYALFGILNPYGQFWTHQTFFTVEEARRHIAAFWNGRAANELDRFKVVPVRLRLELDREVLDPATRLALSEREGGEDG